MEIRYQMTYFMLGSLESAGEIHIYKYHTIAKVLCGTSYFDILIDVFFAE